MWAVAGTYMDMYVYSARGRPKEVDTKVARFRDGQRLIADRRWLCDGRLALSIGSMDQKPKLYSVLWKLTGAPIIFHTISDYFGELVHQGSAVSR